MSASPGRLPDGYLEAVTGARTLARHFDVARDVEANVGLWQNLMDV